MAPDQATAPWSDSMRKGVHDDGAALACTVQRDLAEAICAAALLGVPRSSDVAQKIYEIGMFFSCRNAIGTGWAAEADRSEVADFHHYQLLARPHGSEGGLSSGVPAAVGL